ncbi:hypothetical protein TorRG33x02_160300 [Trema orientale]|uniref:Uncharacterized protein n=1 Tax=Trema orientale TaxID=63057 RepID=A0A2P5ERP1_TREOI|nr:hypothetical protein TorRG33x02_160300 [Trema orientale]
MELRSNHRERTTTDLRVQNLSRSIADFWSFAEVVPGVRSSAEVVTGVQDPCDVNLGGVEERAAELICEYCGYGITTILLVGHIAINIS